MPKNPQYRHHRQCRFCSNEANSREHFYPQWAKALLTVFYPYRSYNVDDFVVNGTELQKVTSTKTLTGDARSSPIKVVCSSCNEGWMSTLQDQNKEIIIAIGNRQKVNLNGEEQLSLSKWAIMTSIVIEYFHPKLAFSTQEEREGFAKTGKIPANWFVWLAAFDGSLWTGHNHFGTQMLTGHTNPPIPTGIGVQSTAWVVADTFFLTARRSEVPLQFKYYEGEKLPEINMAVPIPKIWPVTNPLSIPVVGDETADKISRAPLQIKDSESRRIWEKPQQ